MHPFLERTKILIGEEKVNRMHGKNVFVAGVGGVGSYAVEALARAGVGHLTIHDSDVVSESNINRQLIALRSTIGRKKVEVMKDRILDINPDCVVEIQDFFITNENVSKALIGRYDAVIDAIDVLNCKLAFLIRAVKAGYKVYSSLGAGNKLDPTAIMTGDFFESKNCRLAKMLRKQLRKEGVHEGIKAVWSIEKGLPPYLPEEASNSGRAVNGTISSIPALFGSTLAGLVLKDFIEEQA